MRTTAGPVPAERTKMSAPAGLWIVCALKAAGRTGCDSAIWLETEAIAIATTMLPTIFGQRPIPIISGIRKVLSHCRAAAELGVDEKNVTVILGCFKVFFLLTPRYW